jgi:hypothetical protein
MNFKPKLKHSLQICFDLEAMTTGLKTCTLVIKDFYFLMFKAENKI